MIRRPRRAQDLAETVAQNDASLDHRIMRGSVWVAVSYGGRNLVTLLTTLALVRLLDPQAFGLVALAMTVLVIVDQVQNAGAAAALGRGPGRVAGALPAGARGAAGEGG